MTGSVALVPPVLMLILSGDSGVSALTCSKPVEFERRRRGAEVGVLESDELRDSGGASCGELLELLKLKLALEEVEDVETEEAEEETVLVEEEEEEANTEEEVTKSVDAGVEEEVF